MNIYEQFIDYCRNTEFTETYQEYHHIVPRHSGGYDKQDNLISLPYTEHILAHYYRWLAYREDGDHQAFLFMSRMTVEAKKLAGRIAGNKTAEVHRKNQTNFFSKEWQGQQGKKGGKIGGKVKSKAGFKARQKIGKTYGRDNGISNTTNPIILEVRSSYTKWNHTSGIEVIIEPKEALADIQRELQKHFYFDVRNKSAVRRVILGIRKSIGGWSYSGRAISREALDTSKEPSTTT
jgi:hypothetical protein